MANQQQVVLELLLENKEFISSIKDAIKNIDSVGKSAKSSGSLLDQMPNGLKTLGGGVKSVLGSIFSLKSAIIGAVSAFAGAASLKSVIEAATQQEDAINKAAFAMKRSGEFSAAAVKDLEAFASQLQDLTGVGDDTAVEMFALAKSFGATNEQAKTITKAAIELSAATGKDLNSSVEILGKTLGGSVGKLKSVNSAFKDLTTEQLKNGDAARLVIDLYGGSAATQLQTFSGALKATEGRFGELQEQLGNLIIKSPAVVTLIQGIGEAFKVLEDFVSDNGDQIRKYLASAIQKVVEALPDIIKSLGILAEAFSLLIGINPFEKIADSTSKVKDALEDTTSFAVEFADSILTIIQAYYSLKKVVGQNSALVRIFAPGEIEEADKAAKKIEELRQKLADKTVKIPEIPGSSGSDQQKPADLSDRLASIFEGLSKKIQTLPETVGLPAASAPVGGGGQTVEIDQTKDAFERLKKEKDSADLSERAAKNSGIRDESLLVPFSFEDLGAKLSERTQEAIGEYVRRFKEAAKDIAGSFSQNLLKGKEGAKSFLGNIGGAAADMLFPGAGAAVGPIVEALSGGPDQVKAMVNEFADALPMLIDGIVEAIPVLIETLADRAPDIIVAIISGIPRIMVALAQAFLNPNLYIGVVRGLAQAAVQGLGFQFDKLKESLGKFVEFDKKIRSTITDAVKNIFGKVVELDKKIREAVINAVRDFASKIKDGATSFLSKIKTGISDFGKKIAEGAKNFITSLIDEIKGAFEGLFGGGGSGGKWYNGGADGKGNVTGIKGSPIATGALVTGRGNRDTVPAVLTPGELVLDRTTGPRLNRFIDEQMALRDEPRGSENGEVLLLLAKLIDLVSQPMQVQTTAQVDRRAFADIMLELSRTNARTAA